MTLRAVLFDASGTLIAPREPIGTTYARVARDFGVEIPAWRLDDAFRRILGGAPPLVFPDAAEDAIDALERDWWREQVRSTFLAADGTARFRDFDACFERLFDAYARPELWRATPGAVKALAELRDRGLGLAVVSNFDRRLPALLDALGLGVYLATVVLPSDAGAAKPDPRIFRLALERLGASAEQALFVGDDASRDLAGARAVGIRAAHVDDLATLADLPDRIGELTGENGS